MLYSIILVSYYFNVTCT
uniref:Uncharacterized protein n=1 Tax=Anguilla anguilla TaxID=7936 RepID=A0A0E9VDT3_ANGAN